MQEIYRVLARLMQTDLTVMITGESGTGKELVARALHDYGKRRSGPFVAINMAAIPRDLIESELFGHEKGAFTGANTRSAGRFEQAEGGTLFLDEIGDMPMEAQTRLLRVLQQGEYTTVGGRTPIKTDVRIIAATNKDLRILIQQGLFREDLFFRLNVVPLRLPPLRERIEDVPDLIRHFFAQVEREGLPAKQLDQAALERLKRHRWPGNVRELENLARRLAALYPQETISAAVIDAELAQPAHGRERRGAAARGGPLGRGRAASGGLFRQLRRRPAAARPLSPHPARDRASAAVGDARRHPRQPDPRRRPARASTATRCARRSAISIFRCSASGDAERVMSRQRASIRGGLMRATRYGPIAVRSALLRPGIVAIRQHCCIKASMVTVGDRPNSTLNVRHSVRTRRA